MTLPDGSKIAPGGYGRTREDELVGPLLYDPKTAPHVWTDGYATWRTNGTWSASPDNLTPRDIISAWTWGKIEVTPALKTFIRSLDFAEWAALAHVALATLFILDAMFGDNDPARYVYAMTHVICAHAWLIHRKLDMLLRGQNDPRH